MFRAPDGAAGVPVFRVQHPVPGPGHARGAHQARTRSQTSLQILQCYFHKGI